MAGDVLLCLFALLSCRADLVVASVRGSGNGEDDDTAWSLVSDCSITARSASFAAGAWSAWSAWTDACGLDCYRLEY